MKTEPSPEVKAAIRSFVQIQREKYGENWKEILAAEMAAKTAPVIGKLLDALQRKRRED